MVYTSEDQVKKDLKRKKISSQDEEQDECESSSESDYDDAIDGMIEELD